MFKIIYRANKILTRGLNNGNPYGKAPPINRIVDTNAAKTINFFSLIVINIVRSSE